MVWYNGYCYQGSEEEDEEVLDSSEKKSSDLENPLKSKVLEKKEEKEPPCHCSPLWHNGVMGHKSYCEYFKWKQKKDSEDPIEFFK